ncbi:MAG: methyltransferase domain-containing protein [Opitutaceae bacterium]
MTRRVSKNLDKLGRGAPTAGLQGVLPDILRGGDPLGDFFLESVSQADRRIQGATFTPTWLVDLQLDQIARKSNPTRIVDAGAGTGRYALAAARRWPNATIIAVEKDPALAEAIRINAQTAGLKIQVVCADYLAFALPRIAGVTAFVGNPPYVRHHDISAQDKAWYSMQMRRLGLPHSQLAGLHLYFYLKSYLLSQPGDIGCFVTAAEWMETNYGESMRALFCHMGGDGLIRVHPGERIFPDALTTSVIALWTIHTHAPVSVGDLSARTVQLQFQTTRQQLLALPKWPGHGHQLPPPAEIGPSLGEFFRISRGQVTGLNEIWIATPETEKLIPERYLFPCVTDAMEIIGANGVLRDAASLQRVIDLPADLAELSAAERKNVEHFLEIATLVGAAGSYVAQHRKPWWRVRLKPAPAIVMSYMGRRPPSFARNACGARLINVAHGLTPLRPISIAVQDRLVAWLNQNVSVTAGRTYGGGMVKFEPGDAMSIPLPAGTTLFPAA